MNAVITTLSYGCEGPIMFVRYDSKLNILGYLSFWERLDKKKKQSYYTVQAPGKTYF